MRYFRVIAKGAYLAYYNTKPPSSLSNEVLKPNGVFEISRMVNIRLSKQLKL